MFLAEVEEEEEAQVPEAGCSEASAAEAAVVVSSRSRWARVMSSALEPAVAAATEASVQAAPWLPGIRSRLWPLEK